MELFVPTYLKNTYLYQLETTIVSIDNHLAQFSDTIFHPQGGGQPDDKGSILFGDQNVAITGTVLQRQTGRIFYKLDNPHDLKVGDKVKMKIDKDIRLKHAKLHSAGHIIDLAVQRLKYPWQASKAYHFEDSPYVEYKGKHQNLEIATKQINQQLKKLLKEDLPVIKQVFSYEQALKKGLIPQHFKASLIRMIHFGENSCPCGGTHLQNVKEMQKLEVTKIQKKSKNIRVYYQI